MTLPSTLKVKKRGRGYVTYAPVEWVDPDNDPEEMLARCAIALNCEPRQVYDKLLERLKDNAAKTNQAETPAK